ncbi:hypothetical protein [Larkinella rosea]|uniref:Uncharacterized protein n=1 Tax=Larkinella rosea TaxID=2025312 RepID=A0A3P1C1I0_9BACT|nr:hypothetical protein [Larkinella rosea]RRB07142.1 hypothetical protein EHT25_05000 [Larkinella rosea]
MKKIIKNRLMLAGFYLLVGLILTSLGRAQMRTKNLEIISGKTIFSQKNRTTAPSVVYTVLKIIKVI